VSRSVRRISGWSVCATSPSMAPGRSVVADVRMSAEDRQGRCSRAARGRSAAPSVAR
jgi:hypothetical protein